MDTILHFGAVVEFTWYELTYPAPWWTLYASLGALIVAALGAAFARY